MVAGTLAVKNDIYYMVLSYYDGKKQKKVWRTTKLPVKNNKKKAEEMLQELRKSFVIPEKEEAIQQLSDDPLFHDYLVKWLYIKKLDDIEESTFGWYQLIINNIIIPFFKPLNLTLTQVTPGVIQDFMIFCQEERCVSTASIRKYYSCINQTLDMAFRLDLIVSNPCLKVPLPKRKRDFKGDILPAEDIKKVLKAGEHTIYKEAFYLASLYGLRRSEVVGLQWTSIDFENKVFTIENKVIRVNVDNTSKFVCKQGVKSKKSYRTLPFLDGVENLFISKLMEIKKNRDLFGDCYNNEFLNYLMVNERGDLINPDTLSDNFKRTLKRNNIKEVRFHDLRHSCASLPCKENVPLVRIQEWLGHSNISITANFYLHLLFESKFDTADTINSLALIQEQNKKAYYKISFFKSADDRTRTCTLLGTRS